MTEAEGTLPEREARGQAIIRLIIGLAQGLALYLLYSAFDAKVWPATSGAAFAPLLMVSLFIPLLLTQSVGNLRLRTLILWAAVATVLIAALAWYDIWRAWPWETRWLPGGKNELAPHVVPSAQILIFTAAGLFIAHALVAGGDIDRRFMASYRTHFDVAWKHGVQVALSVAFVGAFWLLMLLGSELFKIIKLTFLDKLIEHMWFAIPVTTLAAAAALHVTDIRAGLVRGARTLALVLLSWLLPMMALFAVGFMVSLPFTGLQPLWETRSAAAILLVAAAALVILINATYQDGENEHHAVPLILRYATRAAAIVLVPIVAIAIYAIWLRVDQYGWTVDRVASVAVAIVAFGYAAGYAVAAVTPGAWMQRIERWNFAMSLVALATLFALFTPIADPARIAVSSQIARLDSGKIAPKKFDFGFLRNGGERFGFNALNALKARKAGPDATFVRGAANDALSPKFAVNVPAPTPDVIARNVTVYPKDRTLPADLVHQNWQGGNFIPPCLLYSGTACDAIFADIDGDGVEEILFVQGSGGKYAVTANVAARDLKGVWSIVGYFSIPPCKDLYEAVRDGKLSTVPGRWRDGEAAGIRLPFTAIGPTAEQACPK
jgi:hypothetical protein